MGIRDQWLPCIPWNTRISFPCIRTSCRCKCNPWHGYSAIPKKNAYSALLSGWSQYLIFILIKKNISCFHKKRKKDTFALLFSSKEKKDIVALIQVAGCVSMDGDLRLRAPGFVLSLNSSCSSTNIPESTLFQHPSHLQSSEQNHSQKKHWQ